LNAPHPGPPSVSASAAPSPTLHSPLSRQHPDNVISESQLQLIPPPDPPSIPQMASPVYAQSQQQQQQQQQQQKEDQDQPPPSSPAPTTPPSGTSSPALDLTSQDVVGRRASAPKRRRIRRAVQPLACYFCRGRKIACGPPRSGDKTCEYVVRPSTPSLKICLVYSFNFFLLLRCSKSTYFQILFYYFFLLFSCGTPSWHLPSLFPPLLFFPPSFCYFCPCILVTLIFFWMEQAL
jgi:hypothetical protein